MRNQDLPSWSSRSEIRVRGKRSALVTALREQLGLDCWRAWPLPPASGVAAGPPPAVLQVHTSRACPTMSPVGPHLLLLLYSRWFQGRGARLSVLIGSGDCIHWGAFKGGTGGGAFAPLLYSRTPWKGQPRSHRRFCIQACPPPISGNLNLALFKNLLNAALMLYILYTYCRWCPPYIAAKAPIYYVWENVAVCTCACVSFSVCKVTKVLCLRSVHSLPLRSGGWSTSGLDRDDIATNSSEVTCFSSHLTSFAILVDASGITGVSCDGVHKCLAVRWIVYWNNLSPSIATMMGSCVILYVRMYTIHTYICYYVRMYILYTVDIHVCECTYMTVCQEKV